MFITISILLVVILSSLIFCLYDWLFTSWDYWTSRGIPSVPGHLPIFGNSLSIFFLKANIGLFCTKIYKAYQGKSMVGFYHLKTPVLIIRDPELAKTVLQTNFSNFQYNLVALDIEADPLFGRDVLFARGEVWKEARNHFLGIFTSKKLKDMTPIITKVCKKLENYLAEKTKSVDYLELDAKSLFTRYAVEVGANTVFSIDGNSFMDDYKGTLLEYMSMVMHISKISALKRNIIFYLPVLSKFITSRFVPLVVDKYFRSLMKDLVDLRQKDNVAKTDVLQFILDLEKNGKISDIETLAFVFNFYAESFESSSISLSLISYLLGKHQEVQNRLRTEVETVLAKHEGQLTYEAIKEMTYLDQVMNESFRLYPVSGALSKMCTEAFRLEGSDGLTLNVEPGTPVLIPTWGFHKDPEFWEDPEEFDPERFAKGKDDGRHKFIYLPFSAGPRACPGRRFGVITVKAAIATIISKYRIEYSSKIQEPIRTKPTNFLLDFIGGFWIKLQPLKKITHT